ncbi:hypothetical protein HJC23_010405 [Cyclotella cryptica]|uniref:Uncharacterized protein n=1 Tax=Cyclotella cryptica TaxID=29204 RepID=A0ABD3QPP8_9STRA|eukprot:CCRYP_005272-RA/>CCRYP_005272-RA protein AED:0.32 eAED:0.32 QI:0/-1/0/1/-1/1/1/0/346
MSIKVISAAIQSARQAFPKPFPSATQFTPQSKPIHSSARLLRRPQKDLFTPSPFAKSDTIPITDDFVIHRELKEGDNVYGVRRYLLLPRIDDDSYTRIPQEDVIASLNASKNILFGARLHISNLSSQSTKNDSNGNLSEYLNACGPLLDVAKEDASINGQQPQALCTLNGLCSWVEKCLENNGTGSQVLTVLLNQDQPNILHEIITEENRTPSATADDKSNMESDDHPRSKQRIRNRSAKYILEKESDRITQLEAVRAIATGIPRPGHTVVGMGTYRNGREAWTNLAWEYCRLAPSAWEDVCPRGLEELVLYVSRNGEVSAMEHLAHTEEGYLREAGGTMARLFFV